MRSVRARALAVLITALVWGGLFAGCATNSPSDGGSPGGNGDPGGGGQVDDASLGTVRLVIRVPESLVQQRLSRLVPDATRLIRVTISATDLSASIVKEVALTEGHGATETVDIHVPSGQHRNVLVEAFDGSSNLLAKQVTVVDVLQAVITSVAITLAPEAWIYPTVTAAASPTSVQVGESVSFSGSGTDQDGSIALHEWDFDSNGTWDYSSATSASTTHGYGAAGNYAAVLRVTDNDGLTGVSDPVSVAVAQRLLVSPLTVDYGEAGLTMNLLIDDTAVSPSTNLSWSITESIAWLTPSATSGTITNGGSATVTLTIDRDNLVQGTYEKTLVVSTPSDGSASVTIKVIQSIIEIIVD